MRRPLAVFAALVALVALLLGDLPGPHRCALRDAAVQQLADAHDCCPKQAAEAAPEGPELCEGDCCGPDGAPPLAAGPSLPAVPSVSGEPSAPERPFDLVLTPRPRRLLAATGPRGPPPRPPGDPPWLLHRALLI